MKSLNLDFPQHKLKSTSIGVTKIQYMDHMENIISVV